MNKNLYVGGLPYSVAEEKLQEIFSAYGTVETARVITDRYTGQSRGFGFVEMNSADEAQQAIQALDGSELEGRRLVFCILTPCRLILNPILAEDPIKSSSTEYFDIPPARGRPAPSAAPEPVRAHPSQLGSNLPPPHFRARPLRSTPLFQIGHSTLSLPRR